jgi:hypothetical protein
MQLDSSPTRSDQVVGRRGPDEATILLDMASGQYFTLDEVGGRIWELCDGSKTVREIAAVLVQEYEAAPEQIEADLVALLDELYSDGLVHAAIPPDHADQPPRAARRRAQ